MLDMIKVENERFASMHTGTAPVHKALVREAKNLIGNISRYLDECKRIMPASAHIIDLHTDPSNERKYLIHSLIAEAIPLR